MPNKINQTWSMDFMSDSLTDGRSIRAFNVVDDYNLEGLNIDVKLTGQVPYLPWAKAKGTYYHWDAIKGTNINGSILGMEIKLTPSINFEFGQEDSNTTSSKSYGKLSVELPIGDNEQFIDFAVDDKPFKTSGVMDLTDLEFVERANKIRIEKTLASNVGTASLGEYNAKTVGEASTAT